MRRGAVQELAYAMGWAGATLRPKRGFLDKGAATAAGGMWWTSTSLGERQISYVSASCGFTSSLLLNCGVQGMPSASSAVRFPFGRNAAEEGNPG